MQSKRKKERPNTDDWLETIAQAVEMEPGAIRERLERYQILPSPTAGTPHRLLLRRIEFSGRRFGVESEGPFSFEWNNLEEGVWGVASDKNLRGKSSILEIVQWLLRGKKSSNFQEDVWTWIASATLGFELDGKLHEVELSLNDGLTGVLTRKEVGKSIELCKFASDEEFEAAMSEFFLEHLGLSRVQNWQSEQRSGGLGRVVTHGWPALAGALFIGTDYSSLLGNYGTNTGIPVRLLQMYLGLPWSSTMSSAQSALKMVESERETRRKRTAERELLKKNRIATLETELVSLSSKLERTESDEEVRRRADLKSTELAESRLHYLDLQQKLRRASGALDDAIAAHAEDRRELQEVMDGEAARSVFRAIEPTCCPRCDAPIRDDRRKTKDDEGSCYVCDAPVSGNEVDTDKRTEVERRLAVTKSLVSKSEQVKGDIEDELENAQEQYARIEADLRHIASSLSRFGARFRLEKEVAVLKARIEEASHEPEPIQDGPDDIPLLKATLDETEKRFKAAQVQVLEKISAGVLEFARKFGMTNLSKVELKGNLNLFLEKGGVRTSYSKVTEGEKLRLKVATVLAMIRVGETEGLGRHPGLLLLDSPGSEELAPEDMEELLSGIQLVSAEFRHLQLFVAARATPAIVNGIPSQKLRYARGDEALW